MMIEDIDSIYATPRLFQIRHLVWPPEGAENVGKMHPKVKHPSIPELHEQISSNLNINTS